MPATNRRRLIRERALGNLRVLWVSTSARSLGATVHVSQQRVLSAVAGLLVTLLALATRADGTPAWLEWSAPPECPSAADIEARAVELFGGPLPRNRSLAVASDLRWTGQHWEIAVEVALDGQRGERRVTVGSCAQAADFVAVAVVLAVDPTSSRRLPSESRDDTALAREETEASRPDAGSPDASPGVAPRAPPARSNGTGTGLTPHISALAEGMVGILPGVHFGGALAAGADIERLALSLGAEWYPPTATTFEEAQTPIDFGLIAARANVAYWLLGPRARLAPSLWFHAGAIESAELDSGRAKVHELWLALGVGPQLAVLLGGPVSLSAEAELNIPLLMPTFVLDDGTEVHRPGVGARLAVGARISLGD